jgi:hypothetical protein
MHTRHEPQHLSPLGIPELYGVIDPACHLRDEPSEARRLRHIKWALTVLLLVAAAATVMVWQRPHPNGSSDGRYHTCGYVTEDGVTEYLDTYLARCGDLTLGAG